MKLLRIARFCVFAATLLPSFAAAQVCGGSPGNAQVVEMGAEKGIWASWEPGSCSSAAYACGDLTVKNTSLSVHTLVPTACGSFLEGPFKNQTSFLKKPGKITKMYFLGPGQEVTFTKIKLPPGEARVCLDGVFSNQIVI